jgi:hypothetical protein
VGVAVRALSDAEQPRVQLLVAADLARVAPEAAGAAFRPAQDGVARGQIHTEPAVTAAHEPVAVHRFTVIGAGCRAGHPRPACDPCPMDEDTPLLVIVDGANVVGSVPDGWWRDRKGAAERLRDRLASDGLPGRTDPVELVLVVEGAARGVASVPGVRVDSAPGSGDDRMVELVAEATGRPCLVVTADRELRRRVTELGAEVTGPRSVRG